MSEVHLASCDRCGVEAPMEGLEHGKLPFGFAYAHRSVPLARHLLCPGCWTALSEWVATGPMERTDPEPPGGWVDTVPVPHG